MEKATWKRERVSIEPGDALVLYTDGITDAENTSEEFYGLERLREVLSRQRGKKAEEIRDAIREEVRRWVGKAAQFDDITLMVLVRGKGKKSTSKSQE
jgi:sigma-B regulation protein RsbU (phosphoserine phosphatase)